LEAVGFRNDMKNPGRFYLWFVMLQACALVFLLTVRSASHESYPRTAKAFSDVNGGLKTALEFFEVDCERYPTTDEGLKILATAPADGSLTNWRGPYFDSPGVLMDPWDHPYVYHFPGTNNTNSYDLYSLGPDGVGNTADDIGNWKNPTFGEMIPRRILFNMSPDELLVVFPLLFVAGMLAQLTFPNVRKVASENPWVDWVWFAIALFTLIDLVTPRIHR